MRFLLILLVAVIAAADVFSIDQSLAPGLSIKNAVLYLLAVALFFRIVLAGEIRIELPDVHALFGSLIGYAIVTCLVAALIVHYPGYHLMEAAISLKSLLIDSALFCLIVFHGLRSFDDVRAFLKCLAAAVCIANILALTDVAGITHIPMHIGEAGMEEGRVYGFFGHANETGSLIACMLPLMLAIASTGRPLVRAFWYAGILASIALMLMTVSRGAFAAVAISAVVGGYLARRYIRLSRFLIWGLAAVAVVIVGVAVTTVVDPQTAGILAERLLGQSTSIDMGTVSSGRTDLWWGAISTMMDTPITFLTGFGWYVYESMPFALATHNWYIDLWFDVGVPGLALFLLIVRRCMTVARDAVEMAGDAERPYLLAFNFSMIAMLVGVFFTLFFKPWPYIWMYAGAILRMAVILRNERSVEAPVPGASRERPMLALAKAQRVQRGRRVSPGIG